jgi:hypothetical protein
MSSPIHVNNVAAQFMSSVSGNSLSRLTTGDSSTLQDNQNSLSTKITPKVAMTALTSEPVPPTTTLGPPTPLTTLAPPTPLTALASPTPLPTFWAHQIPSLTPCSQTTAIDHSCLRPPTPFPFVPSLGFYPQNRLTSPALTPGMMVPPSQQSMMIFSHFSMLAAMFASQQSSHWQPSLNFDPMPSFDPNAAKLLQLSNVAEWMKSKEEFPSNGYRFEMPHPTSSSTLVPPPAHFYGNNEPLLLSQSRVPSDSQTTYDDTSSPLSSDDTLDDDDDFVVKRRKSDKPATEKRNRKQWIPSYSTSANPAAENPRRVNMNIQKPATYATLITLAILTAPDRRAKIRDIFTFIENHAHFLQDGLAANYMSVKHNLSKRNCFIKTPDEVSRHNSWWSVNRDLLPGATLIALKTAHV